MSENSSLYNICTVTNPDDEPFDLIYDGKLYASIQPGQTVRLAKIFADHMMKHLIDRLVQKSGKEDYKNPIHRDQWAEKILIDMEVMDTMPAQEYETKKRERTSQKLGETDLERILKLREEKAEKEKQEAYKPAPKPEYLTPQVVETTPKQEEPPKPKEEPKTEEPPKEPEPQENKPKQESNGELNRDEILKWAKDEMGVNVDDEETMKAFNKMSDEELATAVQYEPFKG